MRPLGRPPMPSARSSPSEPVETDSISTTLPLSPSFITEPLPKARSICASAASSARCLSESPCPTSLKAALLIVDDPLLSHDSANPIGASAISPGPRGQHHSYAFCSRLARCSNPKSVSSVELTPRMILVLDIGGVVYRSYPDEAFHRRWAERCGCAPEALAERLWRGEHWERAEVGQISSDDCLARVAAEVGVTPQLARTMVFE